MDETRQEQIDKLNKVALYVENAIDSAETVLDELAEKIEALDGKTCTGSEHWRDKEHPTRDAKMQALHGKDVSCPIHGKPVKGGRMRSYVGSNPDKITGIREAWRLHTVRKELLAQQGHARNRLRNAVNSMEGFFTNLGWKFDPITGEPEIVPGRMATFAYRTRY